MCAAAPLPAPFTLLFFSYIFFFPLLRYTQYMGQNWGQELNVCECQHLIKAHRAA